MSERTPAGYTEDLTCQKCGRHEEVDVADTGGFGIVPGMWYVCITQSWPAGTDVVQAVRRRVPPTSSKRIVICPDCILVLQNERIGSGS